MPSHIPLRHAAALFAVAGLLALPALAGAGADRGPSPSPAARAAAKCGAVKTRNGGRARYVNTVRARCGIGRRVARRANGKRYRFRGFDCKPRRKRDLGGKLYGCGRRKNGRGQGVGFIYSRR